jgi:murein DD-endopeptidase MepM/ murein hydrolase activator NlpD
MNVRAPIDDVAVPASLQRIHLSVPASLPGDDAPLRRSRQRRSTAADPFEATPQAAEVPAPVLEAHASVHTDPAADTRSERRARRIAPTSHATSNPSVAFVAAPSIGADSRRARRAAVAVPGRSPVESSDDSGAVTTAAPVDIVSDWMGLHAEHQPSTVPAAASSSATSRRARRARMEVAEASNALDVAESIPITRRSRRADRPAQAAVDAAPPLTFEPRATLEVAPVAANPSDLVVASEESVGQSFTIVQDDPADLSSHNAIPDEREAVAVMVEDVPVEPVMASVSPSIVLDPEEATSVGEQPAPGVTVPIVVATTTSITAAAHVTDEERPVFVPRTEIDPPIAAPVSIATAPLRRRRVGRVAAKSFSLAAFSVAGLLTLATSLPANALLSAEDVAAQKVLVTQGDTGSTTQTQTQTVAASGETALETVQRDSYGAMSAMDAAKALGIQPEATFTNDPNGTIQWPFAVGVHIGSGYGARPGCSIGCSTNHKGQDFNPGYGAPIQSIADGVVVESTESGGAFGVKIVIEHVIDGQVIHSLYGHMIEGSRTVEVGDPVTVGQVIGQTGNTGRSTGPHLHFEILLNGTDNVDPLAWLYANTN